MAGITFLQRKDGLQEAVTEGMYLRRRLALARHLAARASDADLRFVVERPAHDRWKSIEDVLAWMAESLAHHQPVLVPLMGGIDHFTVVAGITPRTLILFDSDGLSFVRKASCGLGKGFHKIPPNGLLSVAVS